MEEETKIRKEMNWSELKIGDFFTCPNSKAYAEVLSFDGLNLSFYVHGQVYNGERHVQITDQTFLRIFEDCYIMSDLEKALV